LSVFICPLLPDGIGQDLLQSRPDPVQFFDEFAPVLKLAVDLVLDFVQLTVNSLSDGFKGLIERTPTVRPIKLQGFSHRLVDD